MDYIHRSEIDEAGQVNGVQVARAQVEHGVHHGAAAVVRVEQAGGVCVGTPDPQAPASAHSGTDEAVLLTDSGARLLALSILKRARQDMLQYCSVRREDVHHKQSGVTREAVRLETGFDSVQDDVHEFVYSEWFVALTDCVNVDAVAARRAVLLNTPVDG